MTQVWVFAYHRPDTLVDVVELMTAFDTKSGYYAWRHFRGRC